MSSQRADFDIVGRIGKIVPFDNVVKVNIASTIDKNVGNEWKEVTVWNTVTLFGSQATYVREHRRVGDLVSARGLMQQSSYEKDGEKRYGFDLNVERFDFYAAAKDRDEEQPRGRDDEDRR